MRIRVGHLYPGYLNIYADRGNIAVLARRAALRGHALDVEAVEIGAPLDPEAHDLLYVGGGQDREQALIAPVLAALFLVVTMATLAIPGSANFIGEFYILNGLFEAKTAFAVVATAGRSTIAA